MTSASPPDRRGRTPDPHAAGLLPDHVRAFLEVARCGSVREASETLNIAPSALSRQIQNLEYRVGVPLFERRPRGMALTAAGEIYVRYARQVALETDRLASELEELRGVRRGKIRIATVEGVVADILIDLMADFRRKYQGVSFDLTIVGTDDVVAAVRDGHVDVGISFDALPDPAVKFVCRVRDPLMALVSPDHRLAGRTEISIAELFVEPLAVPEVGFGIRRLIDEQCRRLGRSISPALETNSIEALRGFARSGAGVSLIPAMSFRRERRLGWVHPIPIVEPELQRASMDISVLAGRRLPSSVHEFLRALEKAFVSARTAA